ncbi:helix-turn-helix domain-containing protein [Segatella salivae]|uniref:helix-turn-helix domain-containing protein n=1 Tax=Segatella salivae TaxID=228604 RepID=UPI00352D6696
MDSVLYIKNMVCDRCKMAVDQVMRNNGLQPISVELGKVVVAHSIDVPLRSQIKKQLETLGFELLDDRKQQLIEQIKTAVIQLVHYHDGMTNTNLSDYLTSKLHSDYSALSKLFSEVTGQTIERYLIEQRIERAKELIRYDELSLTQIAFQLNYSSVAHLSSQFKSATGMTPSQFKALKNNARRSLDEI